MSTATRLWSCSLSSLILITFVCSWCLGRTPDEWKSRTIYQALTDRISPTSGSPACSNLGNYCGGTFQGLINHLDYIQKMGFDAIWISPVVTNTPGGYHGYWAQDLYTINPNFGSAKDLLELVSECHSRGMWVMVDVVANHVGPVGYSYNTIVPFNEPSYFHNCNSCPSGCQIQDFTNQPQVEECRLAGLPDLNQTNSFVSSTMLSWIANLTSFYGIDGLRIDTIPEVDISFWVPFQKAAGVFGVGEVDNGAVSYVASYQGALNGVLSYPLFFTLRNTFQGGQSLYNLQTTLQQYQSAFSDLDLLGTFIDNHDQPRFLNGNHDYKCYQNAITYVLMGRGIPIIYYGTEQGFSGAADPNNREILWTSGFSSSNPLFSIITTLISYRKSAQFYAFTRGNTFVALTNGGSNQGQISRNITYQPYSNGQKLCNIFYQTDCVTVVNGAFEVYLDSGESKVYQPM